MNYNTLQEVMEPVADEQQIEALSVYRAFEQIEDGRHKRGVRYSSALILTLIVLAKLAGMTSLAGIAEWVRLRAGWLNEVLPNPRENFPCAATYSNVLRAVDAQQGRCLGAVASRGRQDRVEEGRFGGSEELLVKLGGSRRGAGLRVGPGSGGGG